jgi:hypothetical protein
VSVNQKEVVSDGNILVSMGIEPSQLINCIFHRRTSFPAKICLTAASKTPKTTHDAEEQDRHIANAAMLTTPLAHRPTSSTVQFIFGVTHVRLDPHSQSCIHHCPAVSPIFLRLTTCRAARQPQQQLVGLQAS